MLMVLGTNTEQGGSKVVSVPPSAPTVTNFSAEFETPVETEMALQIRLVREFVKKGSLSIITLVHHHN